MATKYRRGFKTEAEDYAKDLRKELGLASYKPLSPWKLSEHLSIPVNPLSLYKDQISDAVIYCTEKDQKSFSAMTIFNSYRRLIIHNDSHSLKRQAANLAHELSHAILGHIPMPVFDEYGHRYFNHQEEDEANWLGPVLLIPKDAAFHIAKTGMSTEEASQAYGVSEDIIKMRINLSGVKTILNRLKMKSFIY